MRTKKRINRLKRARTRRRKERLLRSQLASGSQTIHYLLGQGVLTISGHYSTVS